ncbi:MAG: hypothetical protein AMXMBFR46_16530 [Acidimicrobiia bacterium]
MADLRPGVFPAMMHDPFADAVTQPFWDAALEGRLAAPKCAHCGTVVLPPQAYCFSCQGHDFEWIDLPGTGTVFSFTVVRHPLAPNLSAVVPYASGVIDLDGTQGAGARMLLNIVDCDPEGVRIGDAVQVFFEPVSDAYAVPRCRPI